jgi:Fur-regulated basic protein A
VLLLKHVLMQRLRRRGIFATSDGRLLSKLTLEEIQQEYERLEREERRGLVKGNVQTAARHSSL